MSRVHASRIRTVGTALGLTALLAACATVGPDYRRPAVADGGSYTSGAPLAQTIAVPDAQGSSGVAQRVYPGAAVPSQWWTTFDSPALDALVERAFTNSPDVAAAQATLRQAQELLTAQRADVLTPDVSAQLQAARQRSQLVPGGPSGVFSVFNAGVVVGYTPDLFGGGRRQIEAQAAQAEASRVELQATYQTLAANVVTTAMQEASLRAQLDAARESVASADALLAIVQRQFDAGAIARTSLLQQQTQAASARAALPPLQKALAQNRHLLAVLVGSAPSQADSLASFGLDDLRLPADLPLTLPSELLQRRPDIRKSEARLKAANADVGVATAALYPHLDLSASIGSEALSAGKLFHPGTAVWSLGAGLLQPLFHGGELQAQRRAQVAAFEAAQAQYQGTVLQAFRQVADTLRALEADAASLAAQVDVERDARTTLDLARQQFGLGATSYLNVLDAQRELQSARASLAQARAARLQDTVALYQALGGDAATDASRPVANSKPQP